MPTEMDEVEQVIDVDISGNRAALKDVRARARVQEVRPDPGRGRRTSHVRRPHGRRRGARRDPARSHHRADRAQRRRQDHVLQPAHRFRPGRRGPVVLQRHRPQGDAGLPGRPPRHGAHLPADQGALAGSRSSRTCGSARPARRARRLLRAMFAPLLARPGDGQHRAGRRACSSGSCSIKKREDFAGSLSGGQRKLLEMARALMAEPRAGHARRADGRREPRAQAVAARAREVAARRGPDGPVRRARHGHGPRHLRLGHRDGPGQGDRRGPTGLRDG